MRLPARAAVALGFPCTTCTARLQCYLSPYTRQRASLGSDQVWVEVEPGPNGEPCKRLWPIKHDAGEPQPCPNA